MYGEQTVIQVVQDNPVWVKIVVGVVIALISAFILKRMKK